MSLDHIAFNSEKVYAGFAPIAKLLNLIKVETSGCLDTRTIKVILLP